jgi:hypothetical protein
MNTSVLPVPGAALGAVKGEFGMPIAPSVWPPTNKAPEPGIENRQEKQRDKSKTAKTQPFVVHTAAGVAQRSLLILISPEPSNAW